MTINVNPKIVDLLVEELPGIIGLVRNVFAARHPGDPAPTDEEIGAAFESAYRSSRDKDDAWLRAHPGSGPVEPAGSGSESGGGPGGGSDS